MKTSLLRFVTAGSIDDGKSTLIGRLRYESDAVCEDQLDAVRKVSTGLTREIDLSYITDGLRAEREQGITIDVAYRHFRTARRRFLIADVPGHEQYTRNMATGASTADLVLILIDSRNSALDQSRRHAYIAGLMGIGAVVVAVNKMDLVGYSQSVFEDIRSSFSETLTRTGFQQQYFIPVSALLGDNVTTRSPKMPWFDGLALLEYLENFAVPQKSESGAMRFPVQYVLRVNGSRSYAGRLVEGKLRRLDKVYAWPSGQMATIAEISTPSGEIEEVAAPAALTLELLDRIDLGRGDILSDAIRLPELSRRLRASLIWMSAEPLRWDWTYLLKHATRQVSASVRQILSKLDVQTFSSVQSQELRQNDIAEVEIETHQPIAVDPYSISRATGSFILIDIATDETVAAGMVRESVKANPPIEPELSAISHPGLTVWFTGLSAAGKSTISRAVQQELIAQRYRTEILDGDVVRRHLSKGLGFSREDRDENIRRIGFVANLLTRNGIIVLVAAISPYRAVRDEVRSVIERFLEVYVNAPLSVCEARDPKGLYEKVRRGEMHSFTGIDDPYESPMQPDVECRTDTETVEQSVSKVLAAIERALRREA